MSTYLERLQAEYDTLTLGITERMEAAANEGRDLTADENAMIEREDARRSELEKAIEHYTGIAERTGRVQATRARVPSATASQVRADGTPTDPGAEILRMFPTPGHYAAVFHAATQDRDKAAIALIERSQSLLGEWALRVTAHQTTADNPGLIPKPIIGPVVDRMRNMRPFIQSIGVNPAPGPKFDRPLVTQPVDVDVQAAEKDPTASQKLKVDPVAVTLATYAGHLNISRQDIRWSQPGILGLVYESFAKVYARRTDKGACTAFATAITATQGVDTLDAAGFDAALGAAGALIAGADGDMGEPTRVWMSRDVAVTIGSLRNSVTGAKLFNVPVIGGTSGDMEGLPVTIDPRFAEGTLIAGDDSLVEYWEDLEGFMMVQEPDVVGQLVGYAGYGSVAVLDKTGFVKLTLPAAAAAPSGG
jgi:HK97 family phage major capsid protein